MNKKFSTLAASALLATAFSSLSAQVEFRAPATNAGSEVTTIKKIQGDKWYQLKTDDGKFLVQQRNSNTGELLIVALDPTKFAVPLLPSLWKIEYIKTDGQGGGKFRFINKETNFPLSFDHTKAVDAKGKIDNARPVAAAMNVEGCNTAWEWYLYDEQASTFGTVAPYSYFHTEKTDSVMALKETNDVVYAVKEAASKVVNNHQISGSVVRIQPVEAEAIDLMPASVNTMIDFHKPSMDKKYASFLFFEPNGNLDNPKALDIKHGKFGALGAEASYQVESNFDLQQKISDMSLSHEMKESPAYKLASDALIAARKQLDASEEDYAKKNEASVAALATVVHQAQMKNDAEEANKKAIADLTKGEVAKHATAMAQGLVDALDIRYWLTGSQKAYDELVALHATIATQKSDLDKIAVALECREKAVELYGSLTSSEKPEVEGFNAAEALYTAAHNVLFETAKAKEAAFELESENYTASLEDYNEAVVAAQDANTTLIKVRELVIAKAVALDEVTNGLSDKNSYIAQNFLQVQYMNDKKGTYLMVDTTFWQTGLNPSESNLLLAHKAPKAADHEAIAARYFFKFTYCPTQDSLIIQPLNASIISNQEAEDGVAWKNAFVGTHLVDATDVSAERAEAASNSWTASATKSPVALKANYLGASGWCLTATAADGKAKALNTRIAFDNTYDYLTRTTLADGVYLLNNLGKAAAGRNLILDMAGGMKYANAEKSQNFEHMPATQWVIEKNSCTTDNGDARVRIVNREYNNYVLFEGHLYAGKDGNVFMLNAGRIPFGWANDTLSVKKIEANDFGYLNLNGEEIENAYHINMFLNYGDNNKSLSVVATANDTLLRAVNPDDACLFEFVPVAKNVKYGYNSATAGTKQLSKSAYMIKVKDADKINNDHKVVGVNQDGKYCVVDSLDMTDGSYIAYFALKENNDWNGEHYYSMVEVLDPVFYGNIYNKWCKLAVEGSQMDTKQSELFEIHTDAFRLQKDTMPYYRRVADMEMKSVVFNSDNNQNRVLYEKAGFMGVHSVAEETADNTIFVDTAFVTNVSRPTYLLARDVNSFVTDTCDHGTHPEGTPVAHWRKVAYTQGRYMIDLGSIASEAIPAYVDATPYAKMYSKYAFVNAIHMNDTLYIMKNADDSIRYQHDLTLLKEKVQYTLPLNKEQLNGAPVAFRFANHEGDMTDGSFYIETTGKKYGFASDKNAWMKEQNNNNVVSTASGKSVDHNNFLVTNYEDIYQALLLNLNPEGGATSNEPITTSSISVIAGEGAVQIAGATGKKVVISNILGQIIANTIVSSDNATIAVPAGIVVVAVEGEAAVKAIVK